MISATIFVDSGTGRRRVSLADYLPADLEETAMTSANAWIKDLRHAVVDGQPMRRRFTYRGDSLWWFTEVYLHKTQTIEDLFRTILAVEQLIERERPLEIGVERGGLARGVTPQIAAAHEIRYEGPGGFGRTWTRLARLDLRARALHVAALASRVKRRQVSRDAGPAVAAFVHRAFWKTDGTDGSAESYIGPVLAALERILPRGAVAYLGVGPTENFAARRWWRAGVGRRGQRSLIPVESLAPIVSLAGSRTLWRERYRLRSALWASQDLRQRAVVRGCDCWPIVREELAGVALLQWPWSARAMDEAAAALEVLRPRAALTYAEAGGWGRALVLEARRRNVPSIGLQHGFIYRHWLNYRHEADEMQQDPDNPADRGFPAPTLTLLFDRYAADHLAGAGHFAPSSLAVTGSARLDGLFAAARALTNEDLARARASATGAPDGRFVLLVTKFRQARDVLPALIDAARAAGVTLAIKTHPAETPDVYARAVSGATHVVVIPAAEPLAPLLRTAGALVTVNSTVALDAAVLGIPALVIGLPNNLSPFVEAGIMAGAADRSAIEMELRKILYDQGFLNQLAEAREAFLDRFGMRPDGRAAERAAEMVLRLTENRSSCGY